MTQNQKILIGVGLLGVGYLLWKSSKKPATTTTGEGTDEPLSRGRGPICSAGLMPCPDDGGCFDPSKNPISDWEAGRPHPCNRSNTIAFKLKQI